MRIPVSVLVTVLWVAAIAAPHAQQPQPSSAVTSVPRMMWLSGVFRPTTIQPVAPVESITVTIYADREGGDALWHETQSVAMEAGGRYSLLMGSTVADGLPVELFTTGEPRWIGVTFNRHGEVEQPRAPMASVPYALKAADADTLGGLPASAYLRAPTPAGSSQGSRSTGRTSPQSSKGAASGDVSVATAGTPGYLGMFTDSTNLGNSVLFQKMDVNFGLIIGLGTEVPRDRFHVTLNNGNGAITGYAVQNLSPAAGAYSGMLFYDQNNILGLFQGFNNTTHEYRINNVARNNLSQLNGSINFMIGGTSRFLVATNGNIGIGVPVPAAKLDVAGDINASTHYSIAGQKLLSVVFGSSVIAGFGAGALNTGSNNAFFGHSSGASTTSNHNTFIGFQGGLNNGAGCCNTFLGAFTANNANVGSNLNTLLGYNTEFGVAGLSNATAIGARATVSQDNSLILGSIAGQNSATVDTKVGIGTTAPTSKLVVVDPSNTGLRVQTNLAGGTVASFGGFGDFHIDAEGVTAGRLIVREDGRVGIGTDLPDHLLSVNGTAGKPGAGAWETFSDERLKTIKGRFTPGLTAVMQLQPVRYEYKPDNALGLKSTGEHIGFSAQAVQKIIPEAVSTNDKGYLLVNNDPILWTMLNAIQEQQKEIADLHRRLAAMEAALAGRR